MRGGAARIAPRTNAIRDAVYHSHRRSDPRSRSGADSHACAGIDDAGSDDNIACYTDRRTDPNSCIRVGTHACPGIYNAAAGRQPGPDPGSRQRPCTDARLHTPSRVCGSANAHRLRAAKLSAHACPERSDHSHAQWQRWSHPGPKQRSHTHPESRTQCRAYAWRSSHPWPCPWPYPRPSSDPWRLGADPRQRSHAQYTPANLAAEQHPSKPHSCPYSRPFSGAHPRPGVAPDSRALRRSHTRRRAHSCTCGSDPGAGPWPASAASRRADPCARPHQWPDTEPYSWAGSPYSCAAHPDCHTCHTHAGPRHPDARAWHADSLLNHPHRRPRRTHADSCSADSCTRNPHARRGDPDASPGRQRFTATAGRCAYS